MLFRSQQPGSLTTIDLSESPSPGEAPNWRKLPVSLGLVVLSAAGFALFSFDGDLSLVRLLTFTGFEVQGRQIVYHSDSWDWWRSLTPVFLHFGWLHVVFNCLWTWDLGGKIESNCGPVTMLALVLLSAVGSNTAQYVVSGPSLFGGMSGVVYALLGFSWVVQSLCPRLGIRNPTGIYVLMIGWLFFCMSGVIEVLGFGAIANGAHVGGLVLGLLLGLPYAFYCRLVRGLG